MTKREAMRLNQQENTLRSLGFTQEEAEQLRRISMTLHRWFEHECNGAIQRDEETNIPYWYNTNTGRKIGRVADREAGALVRLQNIVDAYNLRVNGHECEDDSCPEHKRVRAYVQGDPRGAALYIIRPGDVPEGEDVSSYYSRGICVY